VVLGDVPDYVPKDVRDALINHPDNLQPMLASANKSKGMRLEGSAQPFDR
jgi:hypothetical protein